MCRQESRVTMYSPGDPETFALIDRVATGLAIQLRDLTLDSVERAEGA